MKTAWFGNSAQWLESCTDSVTPQVTVKNFEVAQAITDQNLLGGKTVDGPGCF